MIQICIRHDIFQRLPLGFREGQRHENNINKATRSKNYIVDTGSIPASQNSNPGR